MKFFKLSKGKTRNKQMTSKEKMVALGFIILFFIFLSKLGGSSTPANLRTTTQQEYPSFSEETMDRDCILSCAGGDRVVLWDKPTSASKGSRPHDEVPCGTYAWAFNKYYNKEYDIIFYAINTYDKRVKSSWGWLTADLIEWLE